MATTTVAATAPQRQYRPSGCALRHDIRDCDCTDDWTVESDPGCTRCGGQGCSLPGCTGPRRHQAA